MTLRAAFAVLLALAAASAPLRAQQRVRWEPDERVIIGDFATVAAVAADAWRVYAATADGLISYDPLRRRWDLPLTADDGYPVAERPSALAWSAADQQLVLGTRAGSLWRIDPLTRRVEHLVVIGDDVQRVVPGESGALYVRTPRGWLAVEPGSFVRPIGEPAAARTALDPRLEALRGTIARDARGVRRAITAIVPGPRPDEYYVGTDGNGLLHVDARTLAVEPLPYGIPVRGVTSMARVGATLWFAGAGTTRDRSNIARADTALQQWAWPGTRAAETPRGFVAAITEHAGHVWFGASDGLFRYDVASDRWQRYGTAEGLPAERVTALLVHDSALWVGTARGACPWQGDSCGATLLAGAAVTALSWCQRGLWVGTERGLWGPAEPAAAGRLARERVQGLACVAADTLYAATAQDLWANRAGSWIGPLSLAARGTLRTLAAADGVLWVGGDGGVAGWDASSGQWQYYIAPVDVPIGPVWGVLPDGPYLWLATPGGALRLDLQGR